MGWMVPISLLACMTDTRAVSSVSAARSASGDTMPLSSTGSRVVCPAAPGQRLERVEHRLVLDGAGDQVLPAGRLERLGHAADGEVVALGAAAGEDDLGRIGADQRGHRRSGLVDDRLGPLPEVVDARRVAELLPQRRPSSARRRRRMGGSWRCGRGRSSWLVASGWWLVAHFEQPRTITTNHIQSNP